jgi:hypothetical protein
MGALDVWLEQHPITEHQQTDVVLAHLLAAAIREMFKARTFITVDPRAPR